MNKTCAKLHAILPRKINNLPGEAVLAGFGCVVLIAFIAEHINNYLAFSVCSLPGR